MAKLIYLCEFKALTVFLENDIITPNKNERSCTTNDQLLFYSTLAKIQVYVWLLTEEIHRYKF